MKIKILTVSVVLIIILSLLCPLGLSAASANSVQLKSTEDIYVNDTFYVSFFMNCLDISGIQGTIKYDRSTLELESISSNMSDIWSFDTNDDGENLYFLLHSDNSHKLYGRTNIFTCEFKLNESAAVGDEIKIDVQDLIGTNSKNSIELSDASFSASILKIPDKQLYLKSLSVKGYKLSPEFNRDITKYTLEVPFETDSLQINALANSSDSKIEFENNELKENTITNVKIKVSDKSGENMVYTISVYRPLNPEKLLSKDTKILSINLSDGYLTPEFSDDFNEYSLEVANNVENIDVALELNDKNAFYTVEGNSGLEVGKNTVIIKVVAADKQTDRQIILNVTRSEETKDVVPQNPVGIHNGLSRWIIIAVCGVVVIAMIIIICILSVGKKRKYK